MSAALIGSAIAAGASMLGTGASIVATSNLNKKSYQYNKQLAEQAYERNVVQWNRENSYNTPAAQVARLKAAGLNPNLVYGNGTTATGNTDNSAPNLQYGQWNPNYQATANIGNSVNQGIANALQSRQLAIDQQNAVSQRIKVLSDAGVNAKQSVKLATESSYIQQEIANKQQEIIESQARVKNLNIDSEQKAKVTSWMDTLNSSLIKLQSSQTDSNKASASLSNAMTGKTDQERKNLQFQLDALLPKQVQSMIAEINNTNANTKLIQEKISEVTANIKRISAETKLTENDIWYYIANHLGDSWTSPNTVAYGVSAGVKGVKSLLHK